MSLIEPNVQSDLENTKLRNLHDEQDWLRGEEEEQQWLRAEQDAVTSKDERPAFISGPLCFSKPVNSVS